mgnify:CR=1 FL=1
MNDQHFDLLKELVEAPSPSGFEQPVQRIMRREFGQVADNVQTDIMGNVISRIDAAQAGAPRLMLAGHCDEIGFMVKYIDENGFLFFSPIGGVDAHLVPGQRVSVHSTTGPILGVIGKKPIHLMESKEREVVAKFKNLYIDLGCSSRDEAQKLVDIGDPVTFRVGLERLQGDVVTSRAFDDKMGAFIVSRVMQEVRRRGKPPVELYGVSTVQEEIGLRGATTSCYGVNPDAGIAIDVGFATDFPEIDKREIGEVRVGGGPVLSRGANINPALFNLLLQTAEEEKIPCQVIGQPRATGTDANVMQLSRGGVAAALVSVPLRYMHSPVETLSLADLDQTVALLAGVAFRLKSREDLIPQ